MTPADQLREARALVERGWVQEAMNLRRFGRWHYCAVGAMEFVGAGPRDFQALVDAIGTSLITTWNDDPFRTKAEVLAAFDRAIALAEEAE